MQEDGDACFMETHQTPQMKTQHTFMGAREQNKAHASSTSACSSSAVTLFHAHRKPCVHANNSVLEMSRVWGEECIDLGVAVIKRSWSLIRILIILSHGYANENNTTKHCSAHQYLCMQYGLMSPQRWREAQGSVSKCRSRAKGTLDLKKKFVYVVNSVAL